MTVYVVGNVTEDLVFTMPHLPRDGETLIAGSRLADIGGKGLNQALLLARAGCDVQLLAAVGADEAGARASAVLSREIPGATLRVAEVPTDQSIIYVSHAGENHILSTSFAADTVTPEDAANTLAEIRADDTLIVQGNLPQDTTRAALAAARTAGAWTVANPSPIRWSWDALWPLVDLAVVNRPELEGLTGQKDTARAVAVLHRAGTGGVLLTLGSAGALLYDSDGELATPAVRVDTVDTAGAGDTFAATFVAARLRGIRAVAALRAAAAAAALTVSRRGTHSAFPSREEMSRCLGSAEPIA